jgi:hypothetical protein
MMPGGYGGMIPGGYGGGGDIMGMIGGFGGGDIMSMLSSQRQKWPRHRRR